MQVVLYYSASMCNVFS